MITVKDVEKLLQDQGSLRANTLLQQLKIIDRSREALRVYDQKFSAEQTRHSKEMAALGRLLDDIQSGCEHTSKTYHPDAAGGSDSFHRCDICRKTL